MFRTKYDDHKRVYTEPGDPIKIEYGAKIDKNHNIVVEPKGKFNLYEYIQSFADSVDINLLMKRFSMGDDKAIMQKAAHYIDITKVPTSINEYMQFAEDTKALFESLPYEIKQNFNNNVLEFMSDFEKKGFGDKLELENLTPDIFHQQVKDDEVKNDIKVESEKLENE